MKKRYYLIIVLLIVAGAAVFFLWHRKVTAEKEEAYYIAVAGPMTGTSKEEGAEMLKGIQLYLDKAKKEKKFGNRNIKLRIGDDRNDERRAMKVASSFAKDPRVLLVLGHYFSAPSVAAGEIYKQEGIPAITASATAENLTLSTDWYFRVIPNNRLMTQFIGHYTRYVLNKTSASIIFDRDVFGISLMENFERVGSELGIEIKKKWGFDRGNKELARELKKIVAELRTMEDPGIIFFATHLDEGVRLLTLLKYPGTNYTIICPDSFSNRSFVENIRKYSLEQSRPGYYSDGVYAVSLFFKELGGIEAVRFRNEYVKKYKEEPSWIAACYYDAMYAAAEAIELSEIQEGPGHIRTNRRSIRNSLLSLNASDVAIQGVTGEIYFDKEKNVTRPFGVGVYRNQKFLPAVTQYRMLSPGVAAIRMGAGAGVIPINGYSVSETRIVYTGIDINEIHNLDTKHAVCNLDFYLWFRFQGEFDDDINIEFMNAVRPIIPDPPIMEEKIDDTTIRTYHIRGDFKMDFNYYAYPFDRQHLQIQFRHNDKTRNHMIYVPDTLGMNTEKKEVLNERSGWRVSKILSYQDIVSMPTASYYNSHYSRFNTVIRLERKWSGFVFKNFIPLVISLAVLYSVYLVPFAYGRLRALILAAVTVITAAYHFMLIQNLSMKYFLIIEYAIIVLYGLVVLSASVSLACYIMGRRGYIKPLKWFAAGEKIIFFCAVLLTGSVLFYLFSLDYS
jgi:branched-chain amino acid transport system substrate-binding protein